MARPRKRLASPLDPDQCFTRNTGSPETAFSFEGRARGSPSSTAVPAQQRRARKCDYPVDALPSTEMANLRPCCTRARVRSATGREHQQTYSERPRLPWNDPATLSIARSASPPDQPKRAKGIQRGGHIHWDAEEHICWPLDDVVRRLPAPPPTSPGRQAESRRSTTGKAMPSRLGRRPGGPHRRGTCQPAMDQPPQAPPVATGSDKLAVGHEAAVTFATINEWLRRAWGQATIRMFCPVA